MLPVALLSLALLGNGATLRAPVRSPNDLATLARAYIADRSAGRSGFLATHLIPSFARQTGLACSACHSSFPQLTAFGRLFKLNGYTMTGLQVIQAGDSGKPQTLKLNLIPPISAMVQTSFTQTATTIPGTQNGNAQFPQQLSLFVGGEISPKLGTFLQLTYAGADGALAIDNAELRYASTTELGGKPLLFGVSLNNNPTSQDIWNTVPAWRFPYASSAAAPSPMAAPLLEGALAQQVAGLGTYAMYNGKFFGEYSAYRSAAQGGAIPPNATSMGTISGVASYWRGFYQQTWGDNTIMLGTFGMKAKLFPEGVTGYVNRYTDVAFDGQYEGKIGSSTFNAHGSWLREKQALSAAAAAGDVANPNNTLNSLRLDAGIITASRVGMTVGYFGISGSSDALLYSGDAVVGSSTGSPNSNGLIGELSFMPWLNTRFSAQYVAYSKFNGAKTNYDGAGRKASDNNALYLLAWVAF